MLHDPERWREMMSIPCTIVDSDKDRNLSDVGGALSGSKFVEFLELSKSSGSLELCPKFTKIHGIDGFGSSVIPHREGTRRNRSAKDMIPPSLT